MHYTTADSPDTITCDLSDVKREQPCPDLANSMSAILFKVNLCVQFLDIE